MKEKFLKFIDKFYGFFEMKSFDPENKKHKRIIQKRVDKMLSSPKMVIWIKQAYWFGKDDVLFVADMSGQGFTQWKWKDVEEPKKLIQRGGSQGIEVT